MRERNAGFTMIELVVVLLLLGITAGIALPRLTGMSDFRALAFRDSVAGGLRFAQKTATSHRRVVCATFTATTMTLAMSAGGTCNVPLALPGGSASVASPDASNIYFSPVPGNVFFQADGRITSDAAGTVTADASLSMAGQTVTYAGATGYVK